MLRRQRSPAVSQILEKKDWHSIKHVLFQMMSLSGGSIWWSLKVVQVVWGRLVECGLIESSKTGDGLLMKVRVKCSSACGGSLSELWLHSFRT